MPPFLFMHHFAALSAFFVFPQYAHNSARLKFSSNQNLQYQKIAISFAVEKLE